LASEKLSRRAKRKQESGWTVEAYRTEVGKLCDKLEEGLQDVIRANEGYEILRETDSFQIKCADNSYYVINFDEEEKILGT